VVLCAAPDPLCFTLRKRVCECSRLHRLPRRSRCRVPENRHGPVVQPRSTGRCPRLRKPFHHKASEVTSPWWPRRRYYQRRWQIGFDGKETNIDEKEVSWVIGSGNHSFTYLHQTNGNALQVLPLSWYSEKGGYWEMSPGYDHPDYPVRFAPCTTSVCSATTPTQTSRIAGTECGHGDGISRFRSEGIDCQRCHGPGSGMSNSLPHAPHRRKSAPPLSIRSG